MSAPINNIIGFTKQFFLRKGETWKERIELKDSQQNEITLSTATHDFKIYDLSDEVVWTLAVNTDYTIVEEGLNILKTHSLNTGTFKGIWKITLNGLVIINILNIKVEP